MKTLEILNLAQKDEHQGKKVKSTAFPDMEYEIRDKFIFGYGGKASISVYGHIERGAEWSFVKEQVDFITAIKAHMKKKKISCLIDGRKTIYDPLMSGNLKDTFGFSLSPQEILEGIWTIED